MRFQSRTHSLLSLRNRPILPLVLIVFLLTLTNALDGASTAHAALEYQVGGGNTIEGEMTGGAASQGDPDTGQNKVPDSERGTSIKNANPSSINAISLDTDLDQWLVINLAILKSYLLSGILNR